MNLIVGNGVGLLVGYGDGRLVEGRGVGALGGGGLEKGTQKSICPCRRMPGQSGGAGSPADL